MPTHVRQLTWIVFAAGCAWSRFDAPQCALAQDEPEAAPPAAEHRVDVEGTGIYLDDSFEASDALARLPSLIRADRWREAAELLQGVSDKYGDKLIRRVPGYYIGLRRHVNELIASWPAAGLEAYRDLYEHEVAAALDHSVGSRDNSPVDDLAIVDRYFCTHAALELAEGLAQRAIEEGDFTLAAHVYSRLLDEHPDTRADPEHIRARVAVVRALIGRSGSNETPSSDGNIGPGAGRVDGKAGPAGGADRPSARPADPSTRVRWRGQDRSLGEVLTAIDRDFAALREPTPNTEWPVFAGDPGRNREAHCIVDELGVQWRFAFQADDPDAHGVDEPGAADALEDVAQALTVQPVVAGDLMFVQRNREIVALRRTTGDVAWRVGASERRGEGTGFIQDRPIGWDAVTVADGRVYAALSTRTGSYFGYDSGQPASELLCMDAQTGRVIWRSNGDAFAASSAQIQFDSSPIVEHSRLYIVGRRRRSFGFEDCYLFQVDVRNGRFLSQTHIGSASTGAFGLQPATKAIAASNGDTVFVCSNLGSIAAVSAYTGAVRWIRLYERLGRGEGGGGRPASDVTTWHYNPVLWTERGLVVLPMDAGAAFVVSPLDGDIVQAIPRSELRNATTLLGLHDHLLCVAGHGAACYDLDARRVAWSSPLADGALLLGRGVWADDRIVLPTSTGLSVFRVADGTRTDVAWDPDGEFGNLVALPDQLFVAGARHLTAYVRKSEIWNALRSRLDASPGDPLPALELAEVAMRSGDAAEALDALNQAVLRAEAGAGWQDADVRQRLFADAMAFTRTLAERGEITGESLDRLYDMASVFAGATREHLDYRLRFAASNRAIDRPEGALKLYQQVLADRSLRDLAVDVNDTPVLRASVFCIARIGELIQEHGAAIYLPFEEEAQRLLEGAAASGDADAMARVVEAFPNSHAAPRALLARGTLLAQRGRPMEAVRLLIQAYHRYEEQVDKPGLLKQIADTFEWAGRRADAFRWLTKAALEYPSAVVVDGGSRLTFLQYRDRLNDVRTAVEPRRADLNPPLGPVSERTFTAPMALLVPRFGEEPGMRWGGAFVYADGVIHAIDPRTRADLWAEPLAVRESVDLITARDSVVVFATSFEVFGVDPASGRRLWSRGSYPQALGKAGADWEDVDAIRTHALHGDVLATIRDAGRITAIDIRDGTELWSEVFTPAPTSEVSLGDRLLAYTAMQNDRVVIGLVNAANGTWIDAIATDERRVSSAVYQTLDEQLILVTSQTVSAFDAERRALCWRVSTGDHFTEASILLDLDAVYLVPDGRDLRKISLEDGRVLWEVEGLIGRGDENLALKRIDAQLLVTTSASVTSVDAVTGMVLWRGTTPHEAHFRDRLFARDYVIAVKADDDPETRGQAFFYDLRNASGVIPSDGTPGLGALGDLRHIMVLDGAILFQTGPTTIHGIAKK